MITTRLDKPAVELLCGAESARTGLRNSSHRWSRRGGVGEAEEKQMFRYLRTSVAVGWATSAAAIVATAVLLNGGFGLHRSAVASGLLVSALMGSSVFSVAILGVPSIQRAVLRQRVDIHQARRVFGFVAVFTGGIGLGILVDLALRLL